MTSIRVKKTKIEDISPYELNTKKHPPEQIAVIARSIKEFGFDQPIVVDADGVIIKGHGRYQACQELGLTHVPVVTRDDLTPEQVKAARIADNRSAVSDFDIDNLRIEIADLDSAGFNLEVLGFNEFEMLNLTDPSDTGGEATRRDVFNAGDPVIQYNVVFDDEDQQTNFYRLLQKLREDYPDRTIGAAFSDFTDEVFRELEADS